MSEEVQQVTAETNSKMELWEFIDKYQKTIAVIGVFIAIGLFWKTIYGKDSTPYVAYLCFLIAIPLLIEVWRGYEYNSASWNLRIFLNIFSAIILLTALNLILEYPDHFASLVSGFLWTITGLALIGLVERAGTFLTTRRYNAAVQYRLELIEKYGSGDTTNQLVELSNVTLLSYYKLINSVKLLGIILSVVVAFGVYIYTDSFLHAVVDSRVMHNQVHEIAPVGIQELPRPKLVE